MFRASAIPPRPCGQQVQLALVAVSSPAGEEQLHLLSMLLSAFVEQNKEPTSSAHLRASAPDRLDALAVLLGRKDIPSTTRLLSLQARRALASPDSLHDVSPAPASAVPSSPGTMPPAGLFLQALKILARRQDIRLRCTQHVLDVLVPILNDNASSGSSSPSLSSEAANAASNLAYEAANAAGLVRAGAVPCLLGLLGASTAGHDAHANAAGALQTLSFSQGGRTALLQAGGAAAVLKRLASCTSLSSTNLGSGKAKSATWDSTGTANRCSSPSGSGGSCSFADAAAEGPSDGRVLQRLVGALHNMSSGAAGTAAIRREGGIALLSAALRCQHAEIAASAAGALQNMSREAAARADIRGQPGAVADLAELLSGPDMQVGFIGA